MGIRHQYLCLYFSINLEHNNLTSFSGLIHLVNLRVSLVRHSIYQRLWQLDSHLATSPGIIVVIVSKVLCLNHNHVESVVPRPKGASQIPGRIRPSGMTLPQETELYNPENYTPLLENLEVLHLGYNGIKDLVALQLNRLIGLKALFLQGM